MTGSRKIIHVDMDAFFASVEELDHPELRGQPVVVGGTGRGRGVVSSASYEARRYGIASAMPLAQARRLCPKGVFLPVRMERYVEFSNRIHEILEHYTPLVEPVSIDEAYLDVTGSQRLFGDAAMIAREIKRRIDQELGLTASVGVAPNKYLAKLASDVDKPDGFVVLTEEGVKGFLSSLPVGRIPGVGKAGEKTLAELAVTTIDDLQQVAPDLLVSKFGVWGHTLLARAHGRDDSPVTPDSDAKSIGRETTLEQDLDDPEILAEIARDLAETVGRRLRRKRLKAKRIELKVRFADFRTVTKAMTFREPTNSDRVIIEAALASLQDRLGKADRAVRLLGVTAAGLAPATFEQLGLFVDERKGAHVRLEGVVDRIRDRFGNDSIWRASRET